MGRRAAPPRRGNGRFPYTGTTGGPTKIIAGAPGLVPPTTQ